MSPRVALAAAILASTTIFLACGEEAHPDPVDAGQAPDAAQIVDAGDPGDAGAGDAAVITNVLKVSASLVPDPPKLGRNTMTLKLMYSNGTPMNSSADVTVLPTMPTMGNMGSSETPVAEYQGAGTYKIFPVTFQMAGTWKVTIHAVKGERAGDLVLTYVLN